MRKTVTLFVLALALALFALVAGPRAPSNKAVDAAALDLELTGPVLLRAALVPQLGPSDALDLTLRLEATGPRRSARRAVALVLDRSGSMEGRALENARAAALAVAGRLQDDDALALVSYGSEARLDLPLVPVGPNRRYLENVLDDLAAGGGTHLSAGLAKAQEALASAPAGSVRRILLLSDGYANQGLTDPELLVDLVGTARVDGLGLSTVGVGLDYDEDLLGRLAQAGGGRHRLAPCPEALEDTFLSEIAHLQELVASEVEVELKLAPNVRVLAVKDVPSSPGSLALEAPGLFRFGDLATGESRKTHLTLALEGTRRSASKPAAELVLRYRGEEGAVEKRGLLYGPKRDAPL